jgi:hypothetical protein
VFVLRPYCEGSYQKEHDARNYQQCAQVHSHIVVLSFQYLFGVFSGLIRDFQDREPGSGEVDELKNENARVIYV